VDRRLRKSVNRRGSGGLEVQPRVRLLDTPDFHEQWKAEAIQRADAREFYRGVSELDWTYVTPAAAIQPGERTGRYRIDAD
jgi:putative NADH-flavin reductase